MCETERSPALQAPLIEWLDWLETIHPVSIDMGLDRVGQVADRLQLRPVVKPLILVGGTNGKGSTVAMLSSIYTRAGYTVGTYTSPHIEDFRERICINGEMADARAIVAALARVEGERKPQTLTYFEYTTLAAMQVFQDAQCDVYILEVGLGGRLDATNLWDADCSIVTSIGIDHEAYLGSDINVIATEKAAIGRAGRKLIVGDVTPPESIFTYAQTNDIIIEHVGARSVDELPQCAMPGQHQRRNAACAVTAVAAMQGILPVDEDTVTSGLMNTTVMARFEHMKFDTVSVVLDVAHNPAGAQALVHTWQEQFGTRQGQVIFAALADKDIAAIARALHPIVAKWHCLALEENRAMPVDELAALVSQSSQADVQIHAEALAAVKAAFAASRDHASPILAAGSFHTIEAVRRVIDAAVHDTTAPAPAPAGGSV